MKRGIVLVVSILSCISSGIMAQVLTSKPVTFRLNTMPEPLPDCEAPVFRLLDPILGADSLLVTELSEVEMTLEVLDESKIRYVAVNRDVLPVNDAGIYIHLLRLSSGTNEVKMRSMDAEGNVAEALFRVEYTPPVKTLADRIREESEYYGLLIGIDEYPDPSLESLENPINDAERLKYTLSSRYYFKEIKVLRNPGRSDIIRELDLLRGRIKPEDNLLIFYAGHGYYDEDSESGYWLPSNASMNHSAEWFPNSTLVNYLRGIKSKHTLLITDACFAGSIFQERTASLPRERVYERIYELPSRKAMTSGTMTKVPDQSAFIKYLIKRLEENDQQYFSSEELYSELKNAVISNSDVYPRYGDIRNVGSEGGEFIFLLKEDTK